MLPEDMEILVYTFDTSVSLAGQITFERWQGASQVIAGIVIDGGYAPLVIPGPWVFFPRVPHNLIRLAPTGDREDSDCLVWSLAYNFDGTPRETLQTIDQPGRTRPDRIIDVASGLTYAVTTQWPHGRQSRIAGAIGKLIQE